MSRLLQNAFVIHPAHTILNLSSNSFCSSAHSHPSTRPKIKCHYSFWEQLLPTLTATRPASIKSASCQALPIICKICTQVVWKAFSSSWPSWSCQPSKKLKDKASHLCCSQHASHHLLPCQEGWYISENSQSHRPIYSIRYIWPSS